MWMLMALAFASDDEWELLGANLETGAIAVREHTWHDDSPDMEAHDCGYAGHEGPNGVVLHLLHADGPTRRWTVYDAVTKPEECTPHEVSVDRLTKAKAAFAEAGVDLDAPVPFVKSDKDQLRLPLSSGPKTIAWTELDDPRVQELGRRGEVEVDASGGMGSDRWRATRYTVDGKPWRTTYRRSSHWPMFYGHTLVGGVAAGDQAVLWWSSSVGGMRSATESTYSLERVDLTKPFEHEIIGQLRHDLPAGAVRDVIVQDLDPAKGVAAVKLISHHGRRSVVCDYPGMKHGTDGVLLTVWSFADSSMEVGHEVYAAAVGERACTSPERSAAALQEAKEDAASYGLDPTSGGPERHPLGEVWTVAGHQASLGGASVLVDGQEVGRLPDGATVHSAWSHAGHLVFVLLKGGGDQTVASLSPLYPVAAP